MKAITIAAAAALLGSVSADGWESWSASADPVDSKTYAHDEPEDKTTKEVEADSSTWSDWSSTKKADPTTSSVWSEWNTEKSSDPSSTWSEWSTSKSADPTSVWSEWSTKKSADPSSTWSEWQSTKSSDPSSTWKTWESSKSADPSSASWGEWETSKSADPSSTWKAWESSKSADPSSSSSWSEWETSKSADPSTTWKSWNPTKTLTSTSTQWVTVTVYPADGGQTWSAWDDGSVKTDVNVVTGTVTKTADASEATWSAWATPADNSCQMEVSLSYGPPVWYPTPEIVAAADPTAWGSWDPTKETSTSSSSWSAWSTESAKDGSASASWSSWDPKATPVAKVESSSWSAWDGASSSKPADKTSASSWSAWDGAAKTSSAASSGSTWGDWSQSDKGISANGDKFGMTYSPYTADGKCKDADTVSGDIKKIAEKGFTSVRVYSTDCSTLEHVGNAAKENGMKIILGVFISETGVSGAKPQVDAIVSWAQWELVELIVVGNEAVFQGRCSASELAEFIYSSKSSFQGAGYKGAVSTTDELSIWKGQGAAWCDAVDVVTANLYAFFNADIEASGAGKFIQAQIDELSQVCPGKEVYVMESGWPKAGECNGKACPSPENQATAIKGIQEAAGAKIVFFSFEDEEWKQPGQFGVEQHWGCGDVF